MSFGAEFLSRPGCFPARSGGVPWGERSVVIDFAGGPYLISGLAPEQQAAIAEHLGPYCHPPEATPTAAVTIRLWRAPGEDFRELDVRELGEFRLDVCPGRSGAGKSTLCRLGACRWQVLSDDLNILRTGGETVRVEPFPFAGDFAKNRDPAAAYPLRAVCRLHHASAEAIAPISAGEALGLMFAASPYVNLDPYRGERALTLLGEVASRYPAFALSFSLQSRLDALEQVSRRPRVFRWPQWAANADWEPLKGRCPS